MICLLPVRSREFLVGCGDGAVVLVRDCSPTANAGRKGRKGNTAGLSAIVQEPTKSWLKEVRRKMHGHNSLYVQIFWEQKKYVKRNEAHLGRSI